eukprot:22169_5
MRLQSDEGLSRRLVEGAAKKVDYLKASYTSSRPHTLVGEGLIHLNASYTSSLRPHTRVAQACRVHRLTSTAASPPPPP